VEAAAGSEEKGEITITVEATIARAARKASEGLVVSTSRFQFLSKYLKYVSPLVFAREGQAVDPIEPSKCSQNANLLVIYFVYL
jgi:hypothetical protein